MGQEGTNDSEVYLYDGTTILYSENDYDDEDPRICGNKVVWHASTGGPGTAPEIVQYDHSTGIGIEITQNTTTDMCPEISGSNVVWQGHDGEDYEIFIYDGTTTTQLTNNSYYASDGHPKVSGSNVVWHYTTAVRSEIFVALPNISTTIESGGSPDTVTISWNSLSTHKYRLLESTNLDTWTVSEDWQQGTGDPMTYIKSTAGSPKKYYKTEMQPVL